MIQKRRYHVIRSLVIVVLCAAGPMGCSYQGPTGGMQFAPNGTTVAFLWNNGTGWPWVDGGVLTRNTFLMWCDASSPSDLHEVPLGSVRGQAAWARVGDWRFSLDSRRVAALLPYPGQLVVVDLTSGKRRVLTREGDVATSFAWASANEIFYAICRMSEEGTYVRSFWRQDVLRWDEPQLVLAEKATAERLVGQVSWLFRKEFWSPSGSHVLFMERTEGQLILLDMRSGTSRALSKKNMVLGEASWHPDGRQVFCIIRERGEPANVRALTVERDSGAVVDVSGQYGSQFPDVNVTPTLQPEWTPDGLFVLANHLHRGAALIRPRDGNVVWVGEQAASRTGRISGDRAPWLFRLPIPGWVGLQTTSGLFASTYQGTDVTMLLRTSDWWAFAPDGTLAATLDRNNRLRVHDLGEWWLQSIDTGNGAMLPSGAVPAAR